MEKCKKKSQRNSEGDTHVFDLFDGKVRVGRDADRVRPYVDDDHHRPRDEALEELVNLQISRAQFRARMVPPDHAFPRYTHANASPYAYAYNSVNHAPLTFLNISNIDST